MIRKKSLLLFIWSQLNSFHIYLKGKRGYTGKNGTPRAHGNRGYYGKAGPRGITGPTGPRGPTGLSGPRDQMEIII